MAEELTFAEGREPKMSSGINVLTILTFIGSAIGLIFSAIYPWFLNFIKAFMDKAASSGQEFTSKQLEEMEQGRKGIEMAQANLVPLIIVGVLGCTLCIIGAIMMRRLKKDGFWIYVGGELLPLLTSLVLMGTAQFNGVFSVVMAVGLPVLFIILYAYQRKHLVY